MNTPQLHTLDIQKQKKAAEIYEDYAAVFLSKEDPEFRDHIHLKYEHISRVRNEMLKLCKAIDMTEEQAAFADMLALLHDIGRFEQFERYATFSDAESENHSQIAWEIIEKTEIRKLFSEKQSLVIREAILNHNLPAVPSNASEEISFYSRLLRDADKLDIWRVTIRYNIFHRIKNGNFPDEYQVPEALLERFRNKQIIPLREVDSFYDSILFRISWVYDLNFSHSLEQFSERKIALQLLEKLPQSPSLDQISRLVAQFVKEKV
jgi:hypothetical protein